jgi:hypothetical protein
VAIRGNHHSNLYALRTQSGYATSPFTFDSGSPFELQANLLEERDCLIKGFYNDPDIVHS